MEDDWFLDYCEYLLLRFIKKHPNSKIYIGNDRICIVPNDKKYVIKIPKNNNGVNEGLLFI